MRRGDRKPVEEFPYAEVVRWYEHQRPSADRGRYIANMTRLLVKGRYRLLTPAERGLLHGLWLLRGLTGTNVPRATEEVRESLSLPAGRWIEKAMWTLENRGWLIPRKGKRTGRGVVQDEDPQVLTDCGKLPQTNQRPTKENEGWSGVAQAKRADQPPTNPQPTQVEVAATQPNQKPAPLHRIDRIGEIGNQGPEPDSPTKRTRWIDPETGKCALCQGTGKTTAGGSAPYTCPPCLEAGLLPAEQPAPDDDRADWEGPP